MRKIWLIAGREFWQRVRTRGFILSSLFTPLLLLVVWVAGSFTGGGAEEPAAPPAQGNREELIAYVDEAQFITRMPSQLPESLFQAYPDATTAESALTAGEIDFYYVIPDDYRETGSIRRVSNDLPTGPPDNGLFELLLRVNLLPDADPATVARVQRPFQSAQLAVAAVREEVVEQTDDGLNMMPFLVTILVMVPLFTSGSYLLSSLTEEKSNRVMELLLVSLRPRALLVGKLLGLGALTAVQYVIWIVLGAAVFAVVGANLETLTNAINLTPAELALVFVYALGGYALYATLMAGLGALSPNLEATRSWVFVITLPMLIPIYLWVLLVNAPHGIPAVALSLFPFSAPIAMLMRLASATVPAWQVAVSLALLGITAIFMIWLMSRLFHVQTLLSGESFSVGRFWRALRQA
ncbi:MAG TPA: ABC transporter permease [Candidatus Sulfomarinibacteraceae bacterium]|nr:ABC transporter permease [Candidatus Sulfomarinibacteraceae bacterium]